MLSVLALLVDPECSGMCDIADIVLGSIYIANDLGFRNLICGDGEMFDEIWR